MIRKIAILVSIATMFSSILSFKIEQPFEALSIDERAAMCGLESAEFQLFSGIVEAESNRSTDGDLSGRIMIALTIWNRLHDSRFPSDSVTSVIAQPGQFSTYRRSTGTSCVNGTVYSDQAVIEAYEWIQSGEEYPWVLFFNCRSFFRGYEAYPNPDGGNTFGGNYFSVAEPMCEVETT